MSEVIIFGPLNFFNVRYVQGGVLGYTNIGIKKCETTSIWVLNFGEVGELPQEFSSHPLKESIWKNGSQLEGSRL